MANRRGLKLLLVDDQRAVAESLAVALTRAGHDVAIAEATLPALEAARKARPDVMIVNLDLADADGLGLTRAVHELSPWRSPLFVVHSQRADGAEAERVRAAGVHLHLVRPVDVEALQHLIWRFQSILEGVEDFDPMI